MSDSAASNKHTLAYWPIRGLGALVRAALSYNDIPFENKDDLVEGPSAWYGGFRDAMAQENALVDLPYLRLPNGEVLSQTRALLQYVSRIGKNLGPHEPVVEARINQVSETLWDLHTEKMKASYGPKAKDNIEGCAKESIPYYYGVLEKYVNKNKTEFLATNSITIADLMFAEQAFSFIKMTGGRDFFKDFPTLSAIFDKITNDKKLAPFYASVASQPFNSAQYACWF